MSVKIHHVTQRLNCRTAQHLAVKGQIGSRVVTASSSMMKLITQNWLINRLQQFSHSEIMTLTVLEEFGSAAHLIVRHLE